MNLKVMRDEYFAILAAADSRRGRGPCTHAELARLDELKGNIQSAMAQEAKPPAPKLPEVIAGLPGARSLINNAMPDENHVLAQIEAPNRRRIERMATHDFGQ